MTGNFVGKHLIFDAISKNKTKLTDMKLFYTYLIGVADLLEMTVIVPPVVINFPFANEAITLAKKLKDDNIQSKILDDFYSEVLRKKEQESGVSGILMFSTSHTSAHSWPESDFISIDVYSCLDFDHLTAIDYIKKTFDIINGSISVIKRYTNIPHEMISLTM
jgi:S-adenosylmethionine decarboxylase